MVTLHVLASPADDEVTQENGPAQLSAKVSILLWSRDSLMGAADAESYFIMLYLGLTVFVIGIGIITLKSVLSLSDPQALQPLLYGGFVLTACSTLPLQALVGAIRKYVRLRQLVKEIDRYRNNRDLSVAAKIDLGGSLERRAEKLLEA